MPGIWNTICYMFGSLMGSTRRRVRFTPSTVRNDVIRTYNMPASTNPFFNFLQEMRRKEVIDSDVRRFSLGMRTDSSRSTIRLTQYAGRLWNEMSDREKQPYRKIALEQQKLKRRGRKRRSLTTRRPNHRMIRRNRYRRSSTTSMPLPQAATSAESIPCDVLSEIHANTYASV